MSNKGTKFQLMLKEKYSPEKLEAYQVFYDIVWGKLEEFFRKEQERTRNIEEILTKYPDKNPEAPEEFIWEIQASNSQKQSMSTYNPMSEYYTPTIEEFYTGFIYEKNEPINTSDEPYDRLHYKDNWISKQIRDHWDFPENNELLFIKSWYRVKHLNKEDIESQGFKSRGGNWYHNDKGYQMIGTWENLEISKGDHEFRDVLFKGTVRNLSELKVILKQVII